MLTPREVTEAGWAALATISVAFAGLLGRFVMRRRGRMATEATAEESKARARKIRVDAEIKLADAYMEQVRQLLSRMEVQEQTAAVMAEQVAALADEVSRCHEERALLQERFDRARARIAAIEAKLPGS